MNENQTPNAKIEVTRNGPYLVSGGLPLSEQWIATNPEGDSLDYREGRQYPAQAQYALCRCGHSSDKPFCDGTHAKVGFDGTETASREPYLKEAKTTEGPALSLTDAESFCASARFCDPKGNAWSRVQQADAESQKIAEFEVGHCPSGRLVVWDKATGKAIEPKFEPSIGLIEDPAEQVKGPIWARGGIPVISADGQAYEVRNRVTLCRCGQSNNKPFCDGSHVG